MDDAKANAATNHTTPAERCNQKARDERDGAIDDDTEQPQQSPAHVSPVTRLYRHALESIFAFLPLADLSRVLCVSRSWSAAVRSMPTIGATVYRPRALPSAIAASGLVSHIAQFGSPSSLVPLDSHDLLVVRDHFGSLTSLSCRVEMPEPQPLVFSHKLHVVRVELHGSAYAAVSIQTTIVTLSRLPQLSDLSVVLRVWPPTLDLSPLLGAARLRHLRIQSQPWSQPTSQQIDQLRSLAHLQSMLVPRLNSASIESLLRSPHQLQWQRIHSVFGVDETVGAALSCLPSLTHLDLVQCASFTFVSSLPRLRTLALQTRAGHADDVVTGLTCCPGLTALTLQAPVLSAHIGAILAALPLLTDLALQDCQSLESLSFFRSVDWTHRPALQKLSISNPNSLSRLPAECAADLSSLCGLTSLTLIAAFARGLEADALLALRPPSQLFPLLTQFRYG